MKALSFKFFKERIFKDIKLGPLPHDGEVMRLVEVLKESKTTNKNNEKINVYSVSNTKGFVLSEEFFDKQVYSKNLQNYKVVEENYFAYNLARINVGSTALFTEKGKGLVSPLYVVFKIS